MTILGSCFLGCGGMLSNDDKIIDKRFEQIIEAIENQDKDTLKSMFSAQALSQHDNFEEQISHSSL